MTANETGTTVKRWIALRLMALAAGCAALLCVAPPGHADEELTVEEDVPAEAAPAAAAPAAPAAAAAPKPAAKPRPAASTITKVEVVPAGARVEIRVTGRGPLAAKVSKVDGKYVLDFAGAKYQAPTIILNPPGLGAITRVRGAQNSPGLAKVVVEMSPLVKYTTAKAPGSFTLSLATRAEAGPEEEAATATAASAATVAAKPAATADLSSTLATAEAAGEATGGRARVMHAMISDMPDRVRLVITADGVLRYKMASQEDGKDLVLSLFDVDLAWAPPRLAAKDGPIQDVRAEVVKGVGAQVRVNIKLRAARPYHVRRDQNQVVVEVEKVTEAEAVAESLHRGGDLLHKVTLNVQNEDMASLVKALAFEAGFDNVVLNASVVTPPRVVTITLREIPFAKALNLILSPNNLVWKIDRGVLRVAQPAEFDAELDISAQSGGGAASMAGGAEEEPISTRVFRLKYITLVPMPSVPSTVVTAITSILLSKSKGRVDIDGRSNSLVITDATVNFGKIQNLIRQLDVRIPQVMIRARLVQVNRDHSNTMGINWTLEQAFPSNPASVASNTGATTSPFQLRTGWLGPGFNLDATLNLLQVRGDAKLLLNPSIATLQDQLAHVETTDTVSFRQITQSTLPDGRLQIQDTFVPVNIPMTLEVTPHINTDGTVRMLVNFRMTTVTDQPASGPPSLSVQNAITNLVVRNAETGVIGGILRDFATTNISKVPILGDLPWFLGGSFFRTETTRNTKVELVLFLTPSIAEEI